MPTNLLKKYPDLLDLLHLNDINRIRSLQGVFKRDIEENEGFKFRDKIIRPVKGDKPAMQILFRHLTTMEIKDVDSAGKSFIKRIFEIDRSRRLHWIRYHIEEKKKTNMHIFSIFDRIKGKTKTRTYIYDEDEKYVIVLEPQRSGLDYYLLSAYFFNEPWASKQIRKKMKKKLENIH